MDGNVQNNSNNCNSNNKCNNTHPQVNTLWEGCDWRAGITTTSSSIWTARTANMTILILTGVPQATVMSKKYWIKITENWAKLPSWQWVMIYAKLGAENTIWRVCFTIAALYFQVFFWKLCLHCSNFDSHLSVIFLHKADQLLATLELVVAYVFGPWRVNPAFIGAFDSVHCEGS